MIKYDKYTYFICNRFAKDLKLNKISVMKYLTILEKVTNRKKIVKAFEGENTTYWELKKEKYNDCTSRTFECYISRAICIYKFKH